VFGAVALDRDELAWRVVGVVDVEQATQMTNDLGAAHGGDGCGASG
jgi:hypothetical protein